MAKWVWRYLQGRGKLWARVVRSCYGDVVWGEGGLELSGSHSVGSGWWPKVLSLGGGENGSGLWSGLSRKIGNGSDTKFWTDRWVGPKPLKLVFPRLFHLSENQEGCIADFGEWENGNWVWKFRWRRGVFDRELGAINDLLALCSSVLFSADHHDNWYWSASKDGIFTTKSAYSLLSAISPSPSPSADVDTKLLSKIWSSKASQKARFSAWRTLRNRMPTCDNLSKRNIPLDNVESLCSACFSPETCNHVFLCCSKVDRVWDEIQKWIGRSSVRPNLVRSHFLSFTNLCKEKKGRRFLTSLWTCTVWQIWRDRNACRFEGEQPDVQKTVDKIKTRMWSWNKLFNLISQEPSFSAWFSQEITSLIV